MAGQYADGFDENGQWEASLGNLALEQSGYIVCLGQVPEWMKRQLDAHVRAGRLAKWKGHFNTGHRGFGMGPLKTIYGYPEIGEAAAEIDRGMVELRQRKAA
jgi:hypothetical protein